MKKMSLVLILSGVALGAAGCGHSSPTAPSQQAPTLTPSSATVAIGTTVMFNYGTPTGPAPGICTASGGGQLVQVGATWQYTGQVAGQYQVSCPQAEAPITVIGAEVYQSPVGYLSAGDPNNPGTRIEVPAGAFQVEPLSFTPGRGSAFPALEGQLGWTFSFSVACGVTDYEGAGYFPVWYPSDQSGGVISSVYGAGGGTTVTHPCETNVYDYAPWVYTTPIAVPVYGMAVQVYHGVNGGLGPLVLDPQPTPNAARPMVIGPVPIGWHP